MYQNVHTFSLEYSFYDLAERVVLKDFIPLWDEARQRSYIIYTLTRMPAAPIVTYELPEGTDRLQGVIDGQERIFAIQRYMSGKLLLTEEHLEAAGCLYLSSHNGPVTDGRRYTEEGCEDEPEEHLGLRGPDSHFLPRLRVSVCRPTTPEMRQVIRAHLNGRGTTTVPTEAIFMACCEYIEDHRTGERRTFRPMLPKEAADDRRHPQRGVSFYGYNPRPGAYGGIISLSYGKEGVCLIGPGQHANTDHTVYGLESLRAKLMLMFPGSDFS